jgi:hypothetical protein
VPAPIEAIDDKNLPKSVREVLEETKITEPTPVQKQCWPAIMSGANVLGLAETGSGKTLVGLRQGRGPVPVVVAPSVVVVPCLWPWSRACGRGRVPVVVAPCL